MNKPLHKIRKHIDTIDAHIVHLLNERSALAMRIGSEKSKKGLSVFASEREKEVYRLVCQHNQGPLQNNALKAIYREIMSAALSLEKPLKIAFLGPSASFTHLATIKKFGSSIAYQACDTIPQVFQEVAKGRADYGVVPIENSTEGAVSHTLDMFVDSHLKICSEIYLEIHHYLMGTCKKDAIKEVYSKQEVFGQCALWLERNLPRVECVEVSSTTKAAQIVGQKKNAACIASMLAAKEYHLNILARNIEDASVNITRFLVVGNATPGITGHDKTSIVFSVKDRIGVLHDMLVPFKHNKINLTKIESRPSKEKPWEYYFFIDLEGHCEKPMIKKALHQLENHCRFMKVLGSYPMEQGIKD